LIVITCFILNTSYKLISTGLYWLSFYLMIPNSHQEPGTLGLRIPNELPGP